MPDFTGEVFTLFGQGMTKNKIFETMRNKYYGAGPSGTEIKHILKEARAQVRVGKESQKPEALRAVGDAYLGGMQYDNVENHIKEKFPGVLTRQEIRNVLRETTKERTARIHGWPIPPPAAPAGMGPETIVGPGMSPIPPSEPGLVAPMEPKEKLREQIHRQEQNRGQRGRLRVVAGLPDFHLPYRAGAVFAPSAKAALKWCADNKPDEIVLMGDFLDLSSISHWNKAFPGRIKNEFLSRDFLAGNMALDIVQKMTSKTIYMKGNHEKWLDDYADADPHGHAEILSLETNLRLYDRHIDLYPENAVYKVGEANIIHGWRTGVYHARLTAAEAMAPIFYGHSHDIQCFSLSKRPSGDPIIAHSCGCLCDQNPAYMRNKPNRWAAGFLILYVRDDGSFTYYVPQIINGSFIFAGKEYRG